MRTDALVRAARLLCAVGMHTQGMTLEEATAEFESTAGLDPTTPAWRRSAAPGTRLLRLHPGRAGDPRPPRPGRRRPARLPRPPAGRRRPRRPSRRVGYWPAALSGRPRPARSARPRPAPPRTAGRSRTVPGASRSTPGPGPPAIPGHVPASSVVTAVTPPPRRGRSRPYCEAMRADIRPDRRATVAALLQVVLAGACWALAAVLASQVRLPAWGAAGAAGRGPGRDRRGRPGPGAGLATDLLRPPARTWPALAAFGASVAAVGTLTVLRGHRPPAGRGRDRPPVHRPGHAAGRHRPAVAGVEPAPGRLALMAAGLTLAGAVLVSRAWRASAASTCPGWPPGWPRRCCSPPTCSRPNWPAARAPSRRPRCCGGSLVAVAIWAVAAPWWSWPLHTLADPGGGRGRGRGRPGRHPAAVRPGRRGGAGDQRRHHRRDRRHLRAGVRGRLRLAAARPDPQPGPAGQGRPGRGQGGRVLAQLAPPRANPGRGGRRGPAG